MGDLRVKYANLLKLMKERYTNDDGSELTFESKNFAGRITGLMCLFMQYGVTDKEHFDPILGDDWTWEHYQKVLEELKVLGAVDEFGLAISPQCERVGNEMNMLFEGKFTV